MLIATFGEEKWADLALTRALPSVEEQKCEILIGHDPEGTASSSRNGLAERATSDYLCFLDADDELGPGYIEAMQRAYERERRGDGTPLLLTPAVSRVQGAHRQPPRVMPEVSLINANWLVISTLIPRDLFFQVGGFPEYPIYEDWALMCLLAQAGADAVKVPEAVLYVHTGARNSAGTQRERNEWHWKIGSALWPEHYDDKMHRRLLGRRAPRVRQ